jgi:hypothetical protein
MEVMLPFIHDRKKKIWIHQVFYHFILITWRFEFENKFIGFLECFSNVFN